MSEAKIKATWAARRRTRKDRLREELAYQLTSQKIGRVYSFAAQLEKLTGISAQACYKISQSIFEG